MKEVAPVVMWHGHTASGLRTRPVEGEHEAVWINRSTRNEAKDAQVLPVLSHRPKPGTLHPEGVIRANEAKNAQAWPVLLDTLNRKAPATGSGNRANEAKDAQGWQVMPASVCGDGTWQ